MKTSFLPAFLKKIPFAKVAPTKSGGMIQIHISKMTLQHARWWNSNIQPVIDKESLRADRHWNWILITATSMISGRFLARKPKGYTIGIESNGFFVPCALIQLIGKFPYLIDGKKKSVFVWFLSVAPEQALVSLEDVKLKAEELPKRLGSISLDIAVVEAYNRRLKGRTCLHAVEEGGDKLLNWYSKQGMSIYPKEEKLHFGFRRLLIPSDGRYCYFTEEAALKEKLNLDPYRKTD